MGVSVNTYKRTYKNVAHFLVPATRLIRPVGAHRRGFTVNIFVATVLLYRRLLHDEFCRARF